MIKRKFVSMVLMLLLLLIMPLQVIFPSFDLTTAKKGTAPVKEKMIINNEETAPPTIIAIDPGHGGIDPGTSKGTIIESEVTLDIAEKLKSYLEDKYYSVVMTRYSNISLFVLSDIEGTTQRKELNARAKMINSSGAKIFVSIHVNSYPEYPKMSGPAIYYNPDITGSLELSNCIREKLNGIILKTFKLKTEIPQKADFYILKNTNIPGVLVETAYITNSFDRKLLMNNDFRLQFANATAEGIDYYISKIPVP